MDVRQYSKEELLDMYDKLKTARIFTIKMQESVYRGLVRSSFHTPYGQEATGVAIVTAVQPKDWLMYTHRTQAILINRFNPLEIIAEIFAMRDGICHGTAFDFHVADYREDGARVVGQPSTLGSGVPQGVGFAWARKFQGHSDEVLVNIIGDGGCSEGTVYEAWNLAALYKPNMVFIIENNGWALSTPLHRESFNPDISEKAAACGLPHRIVQDGTNILEVRRAVDAAVALAREGNANVVEIKNLRWGSHFEGQPNDFRHDLRQIEEAKNGCGDCVKRFEDYLLSNGVADQDYVEGKTAEITAAIDGYIKTAAQSTPPGFHDAYRKEYIYATPETGGDL